jgi:hypothetical protein
MSDPGPVSVEIRYNGVYITDYCLVTETEFTGRAGGVPGQAKVVFKDTRQRFIFKPGKRLELFIDGVREWDGYATTIGYNYWFGSHTADCEPCPHVTPRKLILSGVDRNILFSSRVLYNKADPDQWLENTWPANTPDDTVIVDSINNFLDDVDGVDYTTKVENVGSPDPYVEFRVPGPTNTLGQMMTEIAQSTGAIFFINPDRELVYTDVNTPSATYGLSDNPGVGQVGYREVDITEDGNRIINDVMIWGAGQGSTEIVFLREQDATSIATYGRWQNTGGFRRNLWRPDSVQRVAESILYGSPSGKRGHKDPVFSVKATTFTHGFRVGDKVNVESEVHEWSDVIPIREMRITFISPTQPRYDLVLSHEIDEPWTISEWWWPEDEEAPSEEEPGATCYIPNYLLIGLAFTNGVDSTNPGYPGVSTVSQGTIDWFVYIESGDNFWQWTGDSAIVPGDGPPGTGATCRYKLYYADLYHYGFAGPADLVTEGDREMNWAQRFNFYSTNATLPVGATHWQVTFDYTITMDGDEFNRAMESNGLGGVGLTGGQPVSEPHIVQLGVLPPHEAYTVLGAVGAIFAEASMVAGDTVTGSGTVNVPALANGQGAFWLATRFKDMQVTGSHPNITAECRGSLSFVTWTPAYANTAGVTHIDPPDCIPLVTGHQCVQLVPSYVGSTTYSVPSQFRMNTSRVYVDGIHITGDRYTENPSNGSITFDEPPDGNVYICFYGEGTLPYPPTGSFFIRPTTGAISGTFGPQYGDLWPSAYWHGTYYASFHNGVDFSAVSGTPIYAAAGGTVAYETQAAGGTMIHIYHSNGMRTTYAHLSSRIVLDGATVSQGDLIGLSGASGNVTGPHLHWGLTYGNSVEDPLLYTSDYSSGPDDLPADGPQVL